MEWDEMKKPLALLSMISLLSACNTTIKTPNASTSSGMRYYLPQSVISISSTVKKTTTKKLTFEKDATINFLIMRKRLTMRLTSVSQSSLKTSMRLI